MGPFSEEEDQILLAKQLELGNKWTKIASFLPGRPENSIKNRFNSFQHKKQGKAIKSPGNVTGQKTGFDIESMAIPGGPEGQESPTKKQKTRGGNMVSGMGAARLCRPPRSHRHVSENTPARRSPRPVLSQHSL